MEAGKRSVPFPALWRESARCPGKRASPSCNGVACSPKERSRKRLSPSWDGSRETQNGAGSCRPGVKGISFGRRVSPTRRALDLRPIAPAVCCAWRRCKRNAGIREMLRPHLDGGWEEDCPLPSGPLPSAVDGVSSVPGKKSVPFLEWSRVLAKRALEKKTVPFLERGLRGPEGRGFRPSGRQRSCLRNKSVPNSSIGAFCRVH